MAVASIVFVLEVPDHDPGFAQVGPVVAIEALLSQAVVERFDVAVVSRRAWRDVGQPDLAVAEALQCLGNQLRAVVHP